jgi:hypothetical protein
MHCIIRLASCFLLLLVSACTTVPDVATRMSSAEHLAASAAMLPMTSATALPLKGFVRLDRRGADLTVYIEGDGYAWISSTIPSPNPTPVKPVALELAVMDTAPNVAYLGRPGQYSLSAGAEPRYWLSARFSAEVIDAYVSVIGELAVASEAPVIHLVGYSGGAAIAALVASRISQGGKEGVTPRLTLRTVAGVLDTEDWTQSLRLSPLEGSLNPAQQALVLQEIPQLHLVGSRDRQVPASVLDSFLKHMSSQHCVHVVMVSAGHAGPWGAVWKQLLGQTPACEG